MKEYKIIQSESALQLFDSNAKQCPCLQVLSLYPTRRVYAFHGQMGAGKTTFIKQLCSELGVVDVVNSPTFAIVNVYEAGAVDGITNLGEDIYHFDCYRLKNLQEALDFGAEEYLYSGHYCFIEWPQMIDAILPDDIVNLSIVVNDDGTRTLIVS